MGAPSKILSVGAADLAQYLRRAPEGVQVGAWEVACSPARSPQDVAEGCEVTLSAVLIPPKPDLKIGVTSVGRSCFTTPVPGCTAGGASFACAGSWFGLGSSRHLPHSVGGTAALPLPTLVRRWHSSCAANQRALLGVAPRFVEGSCSPDGTLVL